MESRYNFFPLTLNIYSVVSETVRISNFRIQPWQTIVEAVIPMVDKQNMDFGGRRANKRRGRVEDLVMANKRRGQFS